LRDTFGNVTVLTFGRFERNAAQDPAQFAFTPPKGTDVIGDAK
jgi:outer membrane lipoprotein carrier protein